jgi:hypothetical protein
MANREKLIDDYIYLCGLLEREVVIDPAISFPDLREMVKAARARVEQLQEEGILPSRDFARYQNEDEETWYVNMYFKGGTSMAGQFERDLTTRETIADELTEAEADELIAVCEKLGNRFMPNQGTV